jgi:hypothetical protein
LFVHVRTYPLQNYSDDVSICLMYIWSYFELHNFGFTRVLRFRTCAHHMWGAGQWLQKLIPKVCIHGDSYTLKESVGWHKRCGGTMGHHCRDLWSDHIWPRKSLFTLCRGVDTSFNFPENREILGRAPKPPESKQ